MSYLGGSGDWEELVSEAHQKDLIRQMGEQIIKHERNPELVRIYEEMCYLYYMHPVTKPKPTLEDYGRSIKIKL